MSAVDQQSGEAARSAVGRLDGRMEIGELAESRLRSNSYLALRNISCEYRDGALILRGRVPSYYLKQIAQQVVATIAGVSPIVNQIEVSTAVLREMSRC